MCWGMLYWMNFHVLNIPRESMPVEARTYPSWGLAQSNFRTSNGGCVSRQFHTNQSSDTNAVFINIDLLDHIFTTWWRHQMETFSALLAICAGNSPVPGEFPTQRPVTRSFDVYFDLRPNKWLSKQSWGWWFETLSCSLWRHRNVTLLNSAYYELFRFRFYWVNSKGVIFRGGYKFRQGKVSFATTNSKRHTELAGRNLFLYQFICVAIWTKIVVSGCYYFVW